MAKNSSLVPPREDRPIGTIRASNSYGLCKNSEKLKKKTVPSQTQNESVYLYHAVVRDGFGRARNSKNLETTDCRSVSRRKYNRSASKRSGVATNMQ